MHKHSGTSSSWLTVIFKGSLQQLLPPLVATQKDSDLFLNTKSGWKQFELELF